MKAPRLVTLSLPVLGLAVGTRAMLGAGVALLVADRFSAEQRRAAGWTLAAVGALTTVPLVWQILGGGERTD
jgi:hypothetical protein